MRLLVEASARLAEPSESTVIACIATAEAETLHQLSVPLRRPSPPSLSTVPLHRPSPPSLSTAGTSLPSQITRPQGTYLTVRVLATYEAVCELAKMKRQSDGIAATFSHSFRLPAGRQLLFESNYLAFCGLCHEDPVDFKS